MKIERATAGDFADMMEFLLRCFRTVDPLHPSFEAMYPDLYAPTDESMGMNFLVRDSGRIASMAGVFPLQVKIGPVDLRVAGVGGVGTAPEHRGKGGMSALMTRVCNHILRERYPVAWLTGERDRYAHFGWEKAGTDIGIQILKLRNRSPAPWEILELDPSAGSIDRLLGARENLVTRGVCDAALLRKKLRRLDMQVWEARHGAAYAYVVLNRKIQWLAEWGGDPEGVDVLVRHGFFTLGGLHVRIPPVRDAYTDGFLSVAQQFNGPLDNLAVFDLRAFVEAYSPYLQSVWPEGRGLSLVLDDVGGGEVTIGEGSPASGRMPVVQLNRLEMTRFLLGPTRPSLLLGLPESERWLDGVFPIPFYLPSLWRV